MKKAPVILIGILLLLIASVVYSRLFNRIHVPERPSNVPQKATWVGGYDGGAWVQIEKIVSARAFKVKVFNDNSGSLISNAIYQLDSGCPVNKIDSIDLLKAMAGYDGKNILLNIPKQGMRCSLLPE